MIVLVKRKFRVTIEDRVYELEVEVEDIKGYIEQMKRVLESSLSEVSEALVSTPTPSISISTGNAVRAPLSGRIMSIKVKVGDVIRKGTVVAVLESMKTYVEVRSPRDGKVKEILVKEGDTVKTNQPIVILV
ncbi:MAG: acetyl-CoA carboxylase biotin carboxyl carrier protein subunit [Thermoprotei archaeon]|nr:MAG: acetyl-CoA carboxylase biotin carboxyl carrier protein subunit [Thermoprotei archaeon]